jgi:hypothetical protein
MSADVIPLRPIASRQRAEELAVACQVCDELGALLALASTVNRISDQDAGDIRRAGNFLRDTVLEALTKGRAHP